MERRLKASYTVEAAFVIPICIMVMVAIIFLAFKVHDVVVIRSNLIIAGIREGNVRENYMSEETKRIDYESIYKGGVYVGNQDFLDEQMYIIELKLKENVEEALLIRRNVDVGRDSGFLYTKYNIEALEEKQYFSGTKNFERLIKNAIAN